MQLTNTSSAIRQPVPSIFAPLTTMPSWSRSITRIARYSLACSWVSLEQSACGRLPAHRLRSCRDKPYRPGACRSPLDLERSRVAADHGASASACDVQHARPVARRRLGEKLGLFRYAPRYALRPQPWRVAVSRFQVIGRRRDTMNRSDPSSVQRITCVGVGYRGRLGGALSRPRLPGDGSGSGRRGAGSARSSARHRVAYPGAAGSRVRCNPRQPALHHRSRRGTRRCRVRARECNRKLGPQALPVQADG